MDPPWVVCLAVTTVGNLVAVWAAMKVAHLAARRVALMVRRMVELLAVSLGNSKDVKLVDNWVVSMAQTTALY